MTAVPPWSLYSPIWAGPRDLASLYLTDDLQVRALASRSPLLILRSLFRWASLSFAGFFVLVSSLLGCSVALRSSPAVS